MQTRMEKPGVAIAEIHFRPRRLRQARDDGLRDPVRAVTPASEPDGVDRWISHHLAKRRQPRLVRPGEMTVIQEALRMDGDLAVAISTGGASPGLAKFIREKLSTKRLKSPPHFAAKAGLANVHITISAKSALSLLIM